MRPRQTRPTAIARAGPVRGGGCERPPAPATPEQVARASVLCRWSTRFRTQGWRMNMGNGSAGETTMADIAAELGVSRQLVSLVLRGQPGASPETRARVSAAAKRRGYSPHAGARLLRQSTSRQLGVVFAPKNAPE